MTDSDKNSTDDVLLANARIGDERALALLVERYAPRILRFALKHCRNEEDAREIVQEALATAVHELANFRGQSSFSTWLFTIARNYCIKRQTRGAGAVEHSSLDEALTVTDHASTGRADERLFDMQLEQALEFANRDLDSTFREVVLLRDVEGLAAKEVSEILGISVEAVKSRLHRGRAALRERLAPLTEEDKHLSRGSCPDIVELLSQYQEGDVSPAACQTMEAHVASCRTCSVRCTSLRRVLAACASTPTPVLSAELNASVLQQIRRSLQRNRA